VDCHLIVETKEIMPFTDFILIRVRFFQFWVLNTGLFNVLRTDAAKYRLLSVSKQLKTVFLWIILQ
jgi:low temperature requirement protein LtrA